MSQRMNHECNGLYHEVKTEDCMYDVYDETMSKRWKERSTLELISSQKKVRVPIIQSYMYFLNTVNKLWMHKNEWMQW